MKPRILIVEDEFFFADEIEHVLKNADFEVVGRAENESEALEIVKKEKPNIIIMDIVLDNDDKSMAGQEAGINLALKIQKTEKVYIIFLTGKNSSEFETNNIEKVKNNVFLKKPLRPDELIMNVKIARNFLNQFDEGERDLVFISYCHTDDRITDEMYDYLKNLSHHNIKIWRDNHIHQGEVLDNIIKEAISKTKIAILMISSHFLNSKYINTTELPKLIALYQEGKLKIIPVFVGDVPMETLETYMSNLIPGGLISLLGLNAPSKPIKRMSPAKKEEYWSKLSKSIIQMMKP